MKKLSRKQQDILEQWQKHPDDMVVNLSRGNWFLTGGHGIDIPRNTYYALERMGLASGYKLTELGKTFKTTQQ